MLISNICQGEIPAQQLESKKIFKIEKIFRSVLSLFI